MRTSKKRKKGNMSRETNNEETKERNVMKNEKQEYWVDIVATVEASVSVEANSPEHARQLAKEWQIDGTGKFSTADGQVAMYDDAVAYHVRCVAVEADN